MAKTAELRSEEAALIRSAQSGDRAAFGELYQAYAPMVHGVLLARVDFHSAADLAQDTFVKAMKQLGELRDPAAFGGWIAAIARRLATDHHRSPKLVALNGVERAGHPRQNHEAFEVLEKIKQLPECYRETLVLRLVEGLTGPEISVRTGLTADSVRVNLCRGMKLLRAVLSGEAES